VFKRDKVCPIGSFRGRVHVGGGGTGPLKVGDIMV